jgi:fluoroquinolone transport system permease protein
MITIMLKAEQRRIFTDAFLMLMLTITPAVAILLRVYWPSLEAAFPDWQINQYQTALSVLLALLTPMMMGLVLGFNLLAEREQGMLTVVRTTPAGLAKYLWVKSSGYLVVSILLTPVIHELLGFVELPMWKLIFVSCFAQSLLPLSALLLLSFAKNLVEGFAIMKGIGFLVSVPVILAMFVPSPWYWFAAPLPTWWTLWGYFELATGSFLAFLWLTIGTVGQLAISFWLWRRLLNGVD